MTLPSRIAEEKIGEMIRQLCPSHVYSGQQFLMALFEKQGGQSVLKFLDKASAEIKLTGKLDFNRSTFSPVERELFRKAPAYKSSGHYWLGTVASQISGAIFAATGLVGVAKQIRDVTVKHKENLPSENIEPPPLDAADTVLSHIGKFARSTYPTAELLIGATLIYEGHQNKLREKLDHVAEAIGVLTKDRGLAKLAR